MEKNGHMGKSRLFIRKFLEKDAPDVITLWENVFKNDPPWNYPQSIIKRKQAYQSELFLVGLIEGRVIATVLGGYDGFRGWIYHLAVHPDYQKKGYASLLLRQIESKIAEMGCIKINIQIRSSNTEVIDFYRSSGYLIEDHTSMGKLLPGKKEGAR
jgi:ribosomal protein S18 acetylase RimI-like enzyme